MMTAKFHLPGLFEFYELYKRFLPIYAEYREYFYDEAEIASIYGAPSDCIWGGGRIGFGYDDVEETLELLQKYKISACLTFSNSLLEEKHLADKQCNKLCSLLEMLPATENGVIVHSDLLLAYLKKTYPGLYAVSSTTKVQTDFSEFAAELQRPEFRYVVPDFRLNKAWEQLKELSPVEKEKVEFLCNECCWIACQDRKACYENVSRKTLGIDCPDHVCKAPGAEDGYLFSKAMRNPAFIGMDDIRNIYIPMGFSNFKIEGRGLGNALIFEFLLYYLVKQQYQIRVRELIYLDSNIDLF